MSPATRFELKRSSLLASDAKPTIANRRIHRLVCVSEPTATGGKQGNTPFAHRIHGSLAGWSPDFHDLLTEHWVRRGLSLDELRRSLLLASDAKPTIASRWRHRLVCVSEPTAIGGNINT